MRSWHGHDQFALLHEEARQIDQFAVAPDNLLRRAQLLDGERRRFERRQRRAERGALRLPLIPLRQVERGDGPFGGRVTEHVLERQSGAIERLRRVLPGSQQAVEGVGEPGGGIVEHLILRSQHGGNAMAHQRQRQIGAWFARVGGAAGIEEGEETETAQRGGQFGGGLRIHHAAAVVEAELGHAVDHRAVTGVVEQDRLGGRQFINQRLPDWSDALPADGRGRLLIAQVVAQAVEFLHHPQAGQRNEANLPCRRVARQAHQRVAAHRHQPPWQRRVGRSGERRAGNLPDEQVGEDQKLAAVVQILPRNSAEVGIVGADRNQARHIGRARQHLQRSGERIAAKRSEEALPIRARLGRDRALPEERLIDQQRVRLERGDCLFANARLSPIRCDAPERDGERHRRPSHIVWQRRAAPGLIREYSIACKCADVGESKITE